MVDALTEKSGDLSRLTVTQLRAICKERKLTGYSKLPKPALLLKLGAVTSGDKDTQKSSCLLTERSSNITTSIQSALVPEIALSTRVASQGQEGPAVLSAQRGFGSQNALKAGFDSTAHISAAAESRFGPINRRDQPEQANASPCQQENLAANRTSDLPLDPSSDSQMALAFSQSTKNTKNTPTRTQMSTTYLPPPLAQHRAVFHASSATSITPSGIGSPSGNSIALKRSLGHAAALSVSQPVAKKQNVQRSSGPLLQTPKSADAQKPQLLHKNVPANTDAFKAPEIPSSDLVSRTSSVYTVSSFVSPAASSRVMTPRFSQISTRTKNRFKPLVPKSSLVIKPPVVTEAARSACSSVIPVNANEKKSAEVSLLHLDFPVVSTVVLTSINLPPKMLQRKTMQHWAIILSGIGTSECRQCILVSRSMRYAVHLCAIHRLAHDYSGMRFTRIKHQYPQNMTNFWPYLRQRQEEVFFRRQAYDKSFLAALFKESRPVAHHLWTSPDHSKQLVLALRFMITMLWFLISLSGRGIRSLSDTLGTVIGVQEIVKDEIWSVTVESAAFSFAGVKETATFHVLEATCEVVGRPEPSLAFSSDQSPRESFPVRADWSAYIAHRILPPTVHEAPPPPLLAHLSWQNHEEYERGISKVWLKNIATEGEIGKAKWVVAERYVLACVVGNSISGEKMTSTEMEQEFAGLPVQNASRKPKSPNVHLFLPSHHHVESVHFSTAKGVPLHAALAVVQTPAREYYILKDNGMQIGCEEDGGVASVWAELLRCNRLGVHV